MGGGGLCSFERLQFCVLRNACAPLKVSSLKGEPEAKLLSEALSNTTVDSLGFGKHMFSTWSRDVQANFP